MAKIPNVEIVVPNKNRHISCRKWKFFDLTTIKKIRRRSAETSKSHYDYRDIRLMEFAGEHLLLDFVNPYRQGYVLLLKNEIVGFFIIGTKKRFLYSLFVDPKFFNRDIGSYAVEQVEKIFRRKQIKEIILYARLNAKGFYLKKGFEDKGYCYWTSPLMGFKKIKMNLMVKKLG